MASVTIRHVAQAAGVSVATVSRVLNGHASVDPSLVERVNRAVAETGYVLNPTGRALRRQVANVWTVIVPDVNTFFVGVVEAIEPVAIRHGIAVVLCNTAAQLPRERHYLMTSIAQQAAGAIVAVVSEPESDVSALERAGIPTVLIDRDVHDYSGDAVVLDNEMAGRLAAEHLLAQGYRRIACITGPAEVSTTEGRLRGFVGALAQAGHPIEPDLVVRTTLHAVSGEHAMGTLCGSNPPDAVYAATGPLTAGAYQALRGLRGLIEPIALLGNDDEEWTRMVEPQITVLRQPIAEVGLNAARMLVERASGACGPGRRIVLPPALIVRESTIRRHP